MEVTNLDEYKWKNSIENWANLSVSRRIIRKKAALIYAKKILKENKKSILAYKKLFYDIA